MNDRKPASPRNGSGNSALEANIERAMLASRWLLIIFYFGLAFALAVYAVSFVYKTIKVTMSIFVLNDAEVILAMLGLIDACLVASLMVMVMLTGYENYVSRLDRGEAMELAWLGKIDTGSLKVKIGSAIVAISSIHLLQVFLNVAQYDNQKIMWTTLVHLAFVASAFALALMDRISIADKSVKTVKKDTPPGP